MKAAAGRGHLAGVLGAAWAATAPARLGAQPLGARLAAALEAESEERRLFLWLPVASGAGVFLYLGAEREPVVWLPLGLGLAFAGLAVATRHRPAPFCLAVAALALVCGFLSAEWRSLTQATPLLERIRIVKLTGFVEEVDPRPIGSRFVLRVETAGDLDPAQRPRRVRLTTRRNDAIEAGQVVAVTARLLPPSRAALPGGYDFARDAYFAGIGAVGSALGRIVPATASRPAELAERGRAAVDRFRNRLAARVSQAVGGEDAGAVAAAMVTGKRDLLSADGRDIIREAGIFHIITIAGVQMTLVAAMLFGGTRRLLACSRTLALRTPIKAWAAVVAIAGALAYDIGTGSRIGTQRALFMTVIMLGAILARRRALTMRNLALAALAVILLEPEAVAGASFQLSFAAVAALIAIQERRLARPLADPDPYAVPSRPSASIRGGLMGHAADLAHKTAGLFVATVGATAATASFMAADFHELSPYVLVGNPLTLTVIELFAVPGALVGTMLYPLGLDGWVWQWVGLGIRIVLAAARYLAAAPASTVHLPGFAPWALPCLAMALFSVVIWRTDVLRLTAVPWLAIGLAGAAAGPRYDLIVAPTGESVALRGPDGRFGLVGKANAFTAEQWLRADGDPREVGPKVAPAMLAEGGRCDRIGCVAPVPGGQVLSVVADPDAFEEDCRRADIIVTPLLAPASCAAELIVDRSTLEETGALALERRGGAWIRHPSRSDAEDRPWSPAPRPRRPRPVPRSTEEAPDPNEASEGEPVRLP